MKYIIYISSPMEDTLSSKHSWEKGHSGVNFTSTTLDVTWLRKEHCRAFGV
jgi:hypothetical protein